jgi:hypothetical protein
MIFKDDDERMQKEERYFNKVVSLKKTHKEIITSFKNFKGFERSKIKAKLDGESGDVLWDPKTTPKTK